MAACGTFSEEWYKIRIGPTTREVADTDVESHTHGTLVFRWPAFVQAFAGIYARAGRCVAVLDMILVRLTYRGLQYNITDL